MGDGQGWSTLQKTLLAVGIVVAALLAYKFLWPLAEEPPIRVKGGSLEAEIMAHDNSEWKQEQGNSEAQKNWDLKSGGANANAEYFVKIRRSGGSCSNSAQPVWANRVEVDFPAQSFDIRHVGNKTKVKTKGGIIRRTPKLIVFEGSPSQYVEGLRVHGTGSGEPWKCEFTSESQFEDVCLCATEADCATLCED